MALTTGSKVGTYEILGPIGAGGMGEVYRAKDTRLPREAAIKVSALKFSERFAREAHVIASLNHPNITTLYDIGPDYLVMELVEGPTLADRIKQGPLTLDEASNIARQIADALDYAHERGVVHRDLKPGNVKIRPDGVVKVLDFGLAKSGGAQTGTHSDDLPTMTTPATDVGVVLGTPAYMSPEQARGKEVDKRADIWAFGCVFYEMLTGAAAYHADSTQETMASILRDEPDLRKVPAQARRLLKRCLEKDPQKRLRHIGDVMALLDEPPSGEYSPAAATTSTVPVGPAKKWLWPVIATGVLVLAGIGLIVSAPWRSASSVGQAVRFEVAESDKMKFFYGGAMAVSPDGRWMVFPATGEDGVNRYWIRSLETVEARPLAGTETAFVPAAWSADSRYVLFTALNAQQLKRVDIQGGPPQTLADLSQINGAASNQNGVILVGLAQPSQPLFRVPAAGGTAVPATALAKGEIGHKFPQFLPDGRHFLYFRASNDPNQSGVYVGSLDAQPTEQSLKRLVATNREAYYAAPSGGGQGHLIFLRDTTLMAQPFDPVRTELTGESVPIAEGVDSYAGQFYGLFSVSDNGTLVYRRGGGSKLALLWLDQHGNLAGTPSESGDYANPAVSPDGSRVAVAVGPSGSRDLWIVDPARGTNTRLTFDPADDDNPIWSPDGKTIAFGSNRGGSRKPYVKPADGSGEERLLADRPGFPTSWSNDGRFLAVTAASAETANDIGVLRISDQTSSESNQTSLVASRFNEGQAQFSPDGRWVAYTSNESGAVAVYVQPFSPAGSAGTGGAKWLISRGFGILPRWSSDGKQLFYIDAQSLDLMAVDIDTSKGFQAGTPRRLFTAPPPIIPVGWDNMPGDKRFLFVTTPNAGRPAPFTVVVNWAASLKK
jgi:Tol biopolymer transport system component